MFEGASYSFHYNIQDPLKYSHNLLLGFIQPTGINSFDCYQNLTLKGMTEQLIQFIWQYKYLLNKDLITTDMNPLKVINPGSLNRGSGPDFFGAKIQLNGITLVGNIEVHKRASDWLKHQHQFDKAYSNVILHVVWENDCNILLPNAEKIAALELKNLLSNELLTMYQTFMESKSEIPCSGNIFESEIESLRWFIPRLSIERLESKCESILRNLQIENNHWDLVLKKQMGHYLGRQTNAIPFDLLFQSLPHQLWQKHQGDGLTFQSILLGTAGFLNKSFNDSYNQSLKREFTYYQKLYAIQSMDVSVWKYKGLRPIGFPPIRIIQFAEILSNPLFHLSNLSACQNIEQVKAIFQTHCQQLMDIGDLHPIHSRSKMEIVQISESMQNHLLLNAIIPVLFTYGTYHHNELLCAKIGEWLPLLPAEENKIVRDWGKLGIPAKNAEESQALLQLKNYYCINKKCLECSIGNSILKKKL